MIKYANVLIHSIPFPPPRNLPLNQHKNKRITRNILCTVSLASSVFETCSLFKSVDFKFPCRLAPVPLLRQPSNERRSLAKQGVTEAELSTATLVLERKRAVKAREWVSIRHGI